MSNPTLTFLNPVFRVKVDYLLKRADAEGLRLELFATYRSPWIQAQLWMKSRGPTEIERAVRKLEEEGAPWLAHVLRITERPYGRWETNNLPGQSWHQWGEAVKVRILSDSGRVIWNPNHPDYERLARVAAHVNLYSGFTWKNRDAQHVQLRADAVRAYCDWPAIDQRMKETYDVPTEVRHRPQAG